MYNKKTGIERIELDTGYIILKSMAIISNFDSINIAGVFGKLFNVHQLDWNEEKRGRDISSSRIMTALGNKFVLKNI